MVAAIYARKSTEQNGIADEQKSVARQIEHARQYAARKGWTVADEHTYVDDGISGAEFTNRPGFLRLMNALKPRAPFQVLIMSEVSRLGREQVETGYTLKQLSQAGVRVFSYLDDREILLENATDKFMLAALNFGAELEREKASQRAYDTSVRKAKAGHVTGGRTFGYDNLRVDTGGVCRAINDDEAAVVRRIFEMTAAGHGFTTIAKRLNDERAMSPRAQQGRPDGWAPTSVREILYRPIYRGEIVWNRSRKRDRWGVKHQQARPDQEWIRVPAPDLAIVPPALWDAAHAQMDRQRARYSVTRRTGAPPGSNEAKYLLTGLLRCTVCGGGLEARSRRRNESRRDLFYGCASCQRKGRAVCSNNLTIPMEIADSAVLTALEMDLLQPRVLKAAVGRAVHRLTGNQVDQRAIALRRELVTVERELGNLTAVAAGGGDVNTLVAALRSREAQRAALLAQLDQCSKVISFDAKAVLLDLQARLLDWRELLRAETPKARGLLKQLIVGRLNMEPNHETGSYHFRGTGTLLPLLSGAIAVLPQCGTSPPGTLEGWNAKFTGFAA